LRQILPRHSERVSHDTCTSGPLLRQAALLAASWSDRLPSLAEGAKREVQALAHHFHIAIPFQKLGQVARLAQARAERRNQAKAAGHWKSIDIRTPLGHCAVSFLANAVK
jgi:hypothetical protein